MTKFQTASKVFSNLTTPLVEDTPEHLLCAKIKSHIMESRSEALLPNMAFAINFITGAGSILNENVESLFERYLKLSEFVNSNSLRFPLEETLVEELVKLQEDDGAGVGSSGPGSVSAPLSPVATNNTSGVAKLDYPLGEKPKRKKELTEELQLETPEWKDAIGNEKKALFKVHSNGKLAARATIYRLPDGSHEVSDIKTEDEFRRKGVATKLVDHIFTSTNAPFLRFLGGTTSDGTEFFGKYGETKLDGKRVVARPSRLGLVKDAIDSPTS